MLKFLALGGQEKMNVFKPELFKDHSVELTVASYSDIEMLIQDGSAQINCRGESILNFDYVWIASGWLPRTIAYAVSVFLEKHGISYSQIEKENSKLVDTMELGLGNVSIPKTYFSSPKGLPKRLINIVNYCGYPFIMKPVRGLRGENIHLVSSASEFYSAVADIGSNGYFVCQSFIPNDFDYRIIVSNGHIVSAEKRIRSNGEFRNNVALGAQEEFLNVSDVPTDVLDLAVKSAKILGLEWTGADIITSKETGVSCIIEMNRRPGLTEDSPEITAASNHIVMLLEEEGLL